jgi:quercetin dioxygenase-like cupin family protein
MIERVFQMAQNDNHTIEKVITDENVNFNYMILGKNGSLPEHFSNSNVYMAVLDEQGIHEYPAGTVLEIPKGIRTEVKNLHDHTLELIVVKAPAPGK